MSGEVTIRRRAIWRPLLIVAVVLGGLAVVAHLLDPGPHSSTPSQPHDSHYWEDRAYCEQVVTANLPPQYTVGGFRWVDEVNACMVDRGSARR